MMHSHINCEIISHVVAVSTVIKFDRVFKRKIIGLAKWQDN